MSSTSDLDEVIHSIKKVEGEIRTVEASIQAVDAELKKDGLREKDVDYYREKERQLREEKNKLREKENKLRDEKMALQEKEKPTDGRPPSSETNADLISKLESKLDEMLIAVKHSDRATPQYSPAVLGQDEMTQLMQFKDFQVFEGKDDQPSILSIDEARALARMRTEHQVVAFIMPYLQDILLEEGNNLSVYNSEEYKWIETSSEPSAFNEKPDLLISHPAFVNRKIPFQCDDEHLKKLRRLNDQYGVLAAWELRSFIGLTCEAKLSISDAAFGDVINYGSHICFGKHAPPMTRLMLFDKNEFWLVQSVKGAVGTVVCSKWTHGGSRKLLKDFIPKHWMVKVIHQACEKFNLAIDCDSFLGSGAFGYVFRVNRLSDGRQLALKVTGGKEKNICRLEVEYTRMMKAHRMCPGEVMGVEENGFADFERGAALLMSQVGEHFSSLSPQSIMDSLKNLHQNHILHGDIRLENVVCVDGKPCWIDFADTEFDFNPRSQAAEREQLRGLIKEQYEYNAN
ncbi:protein kinase domain containing protein [Nitzschia inconspicua]|uniref:Protein kinase domain containing protein n=1 Tax=Nitzschia inconspicua TaxID=303405 RepID=A0A9K3KH06_9STRA|nr:protein kinase domain containing protein [Nitzschia inconspicua]